MGKVDKVLFEKKVGGIMEKKKLYRIKEGAMLSGVCRGIGEYFEVDETVIRLLWVICSIFLGAGFLGLFAYIVVVAIMPVRQY